MTLFTAVGRLAHKKLHFMSDEVQIRSEVLDAKKFYLRPIATSGTSAVTDARHVAQWRNENREAFFTQYTASTEQSMNWLVHRYSTDPDDLMFMLCDGANAPMGHMAIYSFDFAQSQFELGRVVRDRAIGGTGLMKEALEALLHWTKDTLQLSRAHLEVFDTNRRAIALYFALGFTTIERRRLRCIEEPDRTLWTRAAADTYSANSDRYCLYMEKKLQ